MEELFREEHGRILRLCQAMLGNHHDAEEAVQEAFLRVYLHLEALEGDPSAYLTVVARRVCWNLMRGAAPTEPVEAAPVVGDPTADILDRQVVAGVVSGLSRVDRRLIFGSYAGYSYDELAVIAGTTATAVSVGLHRARKRARKLLEGLTAIPPALRLLWARLTGRRAEAEPANRALGLALATCTAAVGCLLACVGAGYPPVRSGGPSGAPPGLSTQDRSDGRLSLPGSEASGDRLASRSSARSASRPLTRSALVLPPASPSAKPLDLLYRSYLAPHDQYYWHGIYVSSFTGGGEPDQPEDRDMQTISFSPDYRDDHVVFATGTSGTGCLATAPDKACYPFLLVSHDGGRTWQYSFYTSSMYSGGSVLFPPGDQLAPDDSTPQQPKWSIPVMAAGSRGLEMNVDGPTWSSVTPVQGFAAIDPASTPAEQQVLIGATTLMRVSFQPYRPICCATTTETYKQVWQPSRTQVEPGPVAIPGGADSMLFAPGTGRLLIAYHLPSATAVGAELDEVMACAQGICQKLLEAAGSSAISLQGAVTGPGRGVVLAWSDAGLWIADSRTLDFRPVALSDGGRLTSAALSVDGRRLTVAMRVVPPDSVLAPSVLSPAPEPLTVARSDDLGLNWTTATSSGVGIAALTTLTYLPDGHLLAIATASDPSYTVGLICSYDGGMTWAARC